MPRAGLTAQRLTLAAAELADDIGFEQLTVSAVARQFGVSPASVYSHLAGSDELKGAVALLALDEMGDRAAAALAGRSGRDALRAFADSYRDYARAHPGRFAAATHPVEPTPIVLATGRRHTELAGAILRGYPVPENDQVHAIRLLGSIFRGFVTTEAAGGFANSLPDSQQSWERTIDILDTWLSTWPEG